MPWQSVIDPLWTALLESVKEAWLKSFSDSSLHPYQEYLLIGFHHFSGLSRSAWEDRFFRDYTSIASPEEETAQPPGDSEDSGNFSYGWIHSPRGTARRTETLEQDLSVWQAKIGGDPSFWPIFSCSGGA